MILDRQHLYNSKKSCNIAGERGATGATANAGGEEGTMARAAETQRTTAGRRGLERDDGQEKARRRLDIRRGGLQYWDWEARALTNSYVCQSNTPLSKHKTFV